VLSRPMAVESYSPLLKCLVRADTVQTFDLAVDAELAGDGQVEMQLCPPAPASLSFFAPRPGQKLPREILALISEFLSTPDLLQLFRVSHRFAFLGHESATWKRVLHVDWAVNFADMALPQDYRAMAQQKLTDRRAAEQERARVERERVEAENHAVFVRWRWRFMLFLLLAGLVFGICSIWIFASIPPKYDPLTGVCNVPASATVLSRNDSFVMGTHPNATVAYKASQTCVYRYGSSTPLLLWTFTQLALSPVDTFKLYADWTPSSSPLLFSGHTYVGCFRDNSSRDLPMLLASSSDMTVQKCVGLGVAKGKVIGIVPTGVFMGFWCLRLWVDRIYNVCVCVCVCV
jgi:hypothetical protein